MPGVSGTRTDLRFEIDILGSQGARKGGPPFRLGRDVSLGLKTAILGIHDQLVTRLYVRIVSTRAEINSGAANKKINFPT